MAKWIKNKKDKYGMIYYPECSNCGYHWLTVCVGAAGKGHSNLSDAKYCPSCGEKITGIIDMDKEKK